MTLSNKTILVTGAGGGIGSQIVLQLLQKGARVSAVDLNQERLENLKTQAGDKASNLSLHPINITDPKSVNQLPEQVIKTHQAIDGIINCAGIIQPFVKINDLKIDDIDRVMQVNFYGTLHITKAFLPHLLERPEAHIANVSSMGGFLPVPGQAIYGASKAAIKLMTEGLYAELLDTNVRVSVVFPGATNTNISQNSNVQGPQVADQDLAKLSASMLPADQAARLIIKGIEQNKLYIHTGKDSKMMNLLYRLSPKLATKLIARQMKELLT